MDSLSSLAENTLPDRITASAICGTDLHFVRGTFRGVKEGRILAHEAELSKHNHPW